MFIWVHGPVIPIHIKTLPVGQQLSFKDSVDKRGRRPPLIDFVLVEVSYGDSFMVWSLLWVFETCKSVSVL